MQMHDFFLNLAFTFFFDICLCVPTAKSIDSPGAEDNFFPVRFKLNGLFVKS